MSDESCSPAWASGFFDGEGTTGTQARNGIPHAGIFISVGQDHPEPLERLVCALGIGKVYSPYMHPNGTEMYYFKINRPHDVLAAMDRIWPWLGEKKRAQFERALAQYQSAPIKRRKPLSNQNLSQHTGGIVDVRRIA